VLKIIDIRDPGEPGFLGKLTAPLDGESKVQPDCSPFSVNWAKTFARFPSCLRHPFAIVIYTFPRICKGESVLSG
jgi:hypothetical protein